MYVLVLVGVPGAGKSTLSKRLASSGWRHISQDEHGSRRSCEDSMRKALCAGQHIVIDRCNHTEAQRSHWVRLANECGIGGISLVALQLLLPLEVCKARARNRVDHPTLGLHNCDEVIDRFYSEFTEATPSEGFDRIVTAHMSEEADAAVEQLIAEAGPSVTEAIQSSGVWTQPMQHTHVGFRSSANPGYHHQQQQLYGAYGHRRQNVQNAQNGSYGSYYGSNIYSYAHLASQTHHGHARPGSYGYYNGAAISCHFPAEWKAGPYSAHGATIATGIHAGIPRGGICVAEGNDNMQGVAPESAEPRRCGTDRGVGPSALPYTEGANWQACSSGQGLSNKQKDSAKASNCEDASGSEPAAPTAPDPLQAEDSNAQASGGDHTPGQEFRSSNGDGHVNAYGAGGHGRGRGRGTYPGGKGGGGNWRQDGGEQNSHYKMVQRLRCMFADPSSKTPYDTPAEPGTESDQRIILLFDLNGTLTCHTSIRKAKGITRLRPGTEHLLQLRERFRLGIYTSSTVRTVQSAMEMLEEAAGGDLFDRRLVLHREHTAPAPAGHVDAGGKAWDTTKPLGRYFSRLDRVVLVDDDSYKSIEGEEANMLVVPCWQEDDMDCPVLRLLCDLLVAQVASDRQSEDPDVRRWTAIVSEELQKVATKEVEPSSLIATPDVAKSGIKDVRKILGTNGEDRVSGGNDSGGNASEVSGGGACEDEDAGKRRQEPGVERVGKRHRKLPGMILSDPAEIRLN